MTGWKALSIHPVFVSRLIMKITKNLIFGVLLSVFTLSACGSNDDNGSPNDNGTGLSVDPSSISAPAVGGTYTIRVSAERGEWTAYTEASWITLSNQNTNQSTGTITARIAANTTAARQATINIRSGATRQTITVSQQAPLSVNKDVVRFSSRGGTDTLTITATADWTVSAGGSDWIQTSKIDATHAVVTTTANDAHAARTGEVTISSGAETAKVSVVQESVDDREMTIPEGYVLNWHDEFNYSGQLGSDWTEEAQPAGWVNHELQTYIKGTSVNEVSNGSLNIHCFKGNDGKVYSGRVYAHVNQGWQYGYFEARIRLPKGKGTWPAFWMMPVNVDWVNEGWPLCGEIDIMEEVGVVPNEVSSSFHAQGHNHTNNTQVTHRMTIDKAEGEYHIYALEWTPTKLTTYVDGKVQLTYSNPGTGVVDWPYDKPFYVILNLAWGGDWGGMNGVDESALPVTMNVDYVRVFTKK